MAEEWVMVRVKRSTHERAKALRDKMLDDYTLGRIDLPEDQAEHVSFDFLIRDLMQRVEAHRRRAKQCRTRRRNPPSA